MQIQTLNIMNGNFSTFKKIYMCAFSVEGKKSSDRKRITKSLIDQL